LQFPSRFGKDCAAFAFHPQTWLNCLLESKFADMRGIKKGGSGVVKTIQLRFTSGATNRLGAFAIDMFGLPVFYL
jgi:hypothetical protein